RSGTEERRKGKPLDQSLIRKPYLELAHFSVEKPAQFRAKTNRLIEFGNEMDGFAYTSAS
ncbi:hypothetical protein, partial [Agrobacterium vitis]|uniref:hypothetical protein n=1 Tax=Agrobacterium vitis TaxID=373 RepID=UPI001F1C18FA